MPPVQVPSISIFLQALQRRDFDQPAIDEFRPGSALPYSLMRPSVDQVREYLRTLFGCWAADPFHRTHLVEVGHEFMGGNAELRRQMHSEGTAAPWAVLRTSRVTCTSSVRSKIVDVGLARGLRHCRIAVVGRLEIHGIHRVGRRAHAGPRRGGTGRLGSCAPRPGGGLLVRQLHFPGTGLGHMRRSERPRSPKARALVINSSPAELPREYRRPVLRVRL